MAKLWDHEYTKAEEEQLLAFANEWLSSHQSLGNDAWKEFRKRHTWSLCLSNDAIRLKCQRLKRESDRRLGIKPLTRLERMLARCSTPPTMDQAQFERLVAMNPFHAGSAKKADLVITILPRDVSTKIEDLATNTPPTTENLPTTVSTTSDLKENKPGSSIISESVAVALYERALQMISGRLTPAHADGQLILAPVNKNDSNIQPIAMQQLLDQLKTLFVNYLSLKIQQCGDKIAETASPTDRDTLNDLLKQLRNFLGEELEKLIKKVLKETG